MLDLLKTILLWGCPLLIVLILVFAWWRRVERATSGRPFTALRARLGWGLGMRELARRLDVPQKELTSFEPRYRSVAVPKRSGGYRKLLVPDRDTKYLQRRILWRLLAKLRAHPAACGFEKGKSIVHNALPHVGRAIVVKIDVEDFFPSTATARVERYFRRIGWDAKAAAWLTGATCCEGGLPQGAPTSPRLSNLVNYGLDFALAAHAGHVGCIYTRYADDITFSFPHGDMSSGARGSVHATRKALARVGYTMHERKKLSIRRSHQQQRVTGLVVNEKLQLPRKTRRWLRAVKHRQATRGYSSLKPEQLEGWLALEKMIEKQRGDAAGDR